MPSPYIKPKPEYATAMRAKWGATAPAGSDPADIAAISTAFAGGMITEQYAAHLVTQAATSELPGAIEALKHGAPVSASRPAGSSANAAAPGRPNGSASWDPTITKSFSPAALDRMRGGPPQTEMSEADLNAHFERSRAARQLRTGRKS